MPPPPAAPPRLGLRAALEAAGQALRAGDPAEAERLARLALVSARVDPAALKLLGQALILQGRAAEAIEPLKRALRRRPDAEGRALVARAVLEVGDSLDKAGRYAEAAEVFEEGLALAPDAQVLRVGLGYAALHRNDRSAARAAFTEVHAAAPDRFDATLGLAHALTADGDYAQAAELFGHALALRPDDNGVRIDLARCQLELGRREAGEASLRAAAHAAPQGLWPAIAALSSASKGRLFLRPSAAVAFLRGG